MAKGISNTSRTLKYIREKGWVADMVERWIPMPTHPAKGFRKDYLGFGDIIALGENSIIAIQSCGQAFAAHHRKITEDEFVAPNAQKWLENGGRLILIGWRKTLKDRKGKMKYWTPRIREYFFDKKNMNWKDLT